MAATQRSLRRAAGLVVMGTVALVTWLYVADLFSYAPLDFSFTLRHFRSFMTQRERDIALKTLRTIKETCLKSNITFMLYGGSLIGAYRHHGFVPWDDDADVWVNASDKSRLKEALISLKGFQLHSPLNSVWKLFNRSSPLLFPERSYTWPFVDIYFFAENTTHIWEQLKQYRDEYVFEKSTVFPLRQGVFEGRPFPVPRCTESFLSKTYQLDVCESTLGHNKQDKRPGRFVAKVPCSDLRPYFPFVERTVSRDGSVNAALKFQNRILHITEENRRC